MEQNWANQQRVQAASKVRNPTVRQTLLNHTKDKTEGHLFSDVSGIFHERNKIYFREVEMTSTAQRPKEFVWDIHKVTLVWVTNKTLII